MKVRCGWCGFTRTPADPNYLAKMCYVCSRYGKQEWVRE